ncbi:MAG: hypothetical protein M0Z71_06875 [Nitrospiraceae bacterium]|nr:hypothetical protein [Nitrospiraceae bacterium]
MPSSGQGIQLFTDMLEYFALTRKLQKKIDGAAEDLASGLNGRLEGGGFWKGMPKVYTYEKDIPVQISFFNGGAKIPHLFTRLILYGSNNGNIHIRIYNEGVFSRLLKRLGMRGLEIGDPEFDRLFVIKSNNTAAAKLLIDSTTTHCIRTLYDNQQTIIDAVADVPDSVRERAKDRGMATAMKIAELFFTPSRPTFEMVLDQKGLSLEIFGLLNRDKARMLLDELATIYSAWHLTHKA